MVLKCFIYNPPNIPFETIFPYNIPQTSWQVWGYSRCSYPPRAKILPSDTIRAYTEHNIYKHVLRLAAIVVYLPSWYKCTFLALNMFVISLVARNSLEAQMGHEFKIYDLCVVPSFKPLIYRKCYKRFCCYFWQSQTERLPVSPGGWAVPQNTALMKHLSAWLCVPRVYRADHVWED